MNQSKESLCRTIAESARKNFLAKEKGISLQELQDLVEITARLAPDEDTASLLRSMVDIGWNASSGGEAFNLAYAKSLQFAKNRPRY